MPLEDLSNLISIRNFISVLLNRYSLEDPSWIDFSKLKEIERVFDKKIALEIEKTFKNDI